jgi:hypothetical protein
MMRADGVTVDAVTAGIEVHGDVVASSHIVHETVVRLIGNRVGLDDAEPRVDEDAGLGADALADPAQSQR